MRKLGHIKSTGTAGTYTGHSVASPWGALGHDTQVETGKKSKVIHLLKKYLVNASSGSLYHLAIWRTEW